MIKPFIPRYLQITLRRKIVFSRRSKYKHIWPIDPAAGKAPEGWAGWPDQKRFALVLTHDVDTQIGQKRCRSVSKIEEEMGFRSSFNFVPERYEVSSKLRQYLCDRGFEIGVHGLLHDGKLFKSEKIFQRRAIKINQYLKDWGAVGFRSPAMHHYLDWIHQLNIDYDASTFDTDPFEPQADGQGTIFPFWVQKNSHQNGYAELPYTLPQDFTLFVLMREKNIYIWKQKLDWIVENGGMALVNVHPDYTNFNEKELGLEEYPAKFYADFLEYIISRYDNKYWHVLPKDMAVYCKGIQMREKEVLK